jgi:hypothetical protein
MELKSLNPKVHLIRSSVYGVCITFVYLLLVNIEFILTKRIFGSIAFFGLILIGFEIYFTNKYINEYLTLKNKYQKYSIVHHLLNHIFYPIITFFSLTLFLLVQNNLFLSYSLILLNLILSIPYFYFLPYHIIYGHKADARSKYSDIKIDFLNYIYKFFSFYIILTSLFTYFAQSRITIAFLTLSIFIISFIYLFFHIYRKNKYSHLNLFLAFLFSIIFTFFSITLIGNNSNLNSLTSILFFYLTSAIFYHKVDGTFNYRVLIEYSSLSLIASILLFSVR